MMVVQSSEDQRVVHGPLKEEVGRRRREQRRALWEVFFIP
jgi:hypothetical protein